MEPRFLAFVGFAAFIAAVAYLSYREDRKRRRLLRAWARSHGFAMTATRQTGWEREYPAYKLFGYGHSRHSALHLDGEVDGHRVRCLDYRYTTGSGKNRKTHRYAVVILDAGTPVIPLHIRREHVFDRVGEFFGGGDINFESDEFSRRFHVSSSDRKWAYDVIQTAMMDFLLAADVQHVEFGVAEVAVYRVGPLTGQRCQADVKLVKQIFDLVPAQVLAQLRGEPR
ncbi:MAG: hypothetical protein R3D98_05990 [Candidatus Krumholzibacteriia bacterium]